jgi:hypothetical protein
MTPTFALPIAIAAFVVNPCTDSLAQGPAGNHPQIQDNVLAYHGGADRSGHFVAPGLTWERARSPVRGIPVVSLCLRRGSLLRRPVELSFVDPHPMQNDCELARDGDLRLAESISLGESDPSGLKRRPFRRAGQQYAGCLEQIHAEHRALSSS